MNAHLVLSDDGSVLAELKARPLCIQWIIDAQKVDNDLLEKRGQCDSNVDSEFRDDAKVVWGLETEYVSREIQSWSWWFLVKLTAVG